MTTELKVGDVVRLNSEDERQMTVEDICDYMDAVGCVWFSPEGYICRTRLPKEALKAIAVQR